MKRILLYIIGVICTITASAQYNVDRLIVSGRAALYYEDYVLSIQYFNQAINQKPFLWEPWQLRAIAKFSLEDYVGAENDATKAIQLNPYIPQIYDLRAISRIRQDKFDDAIDDYTKAISYDPMHKEYWHNRAICRMENNDYEGASVEVDTIISKWQQYSPSYLLKSQILLRQNDTITATKWVDRLLEFDKYNADALRLRAHFYLWEEKWKEADETFTSVLHMKPKQVECYLNRAVARLKLNNLRGAMADYDFALEFDPTNFLGHYNRGLLRQQVGDDNRAIEDFNFVLSLEPDNVMALFNRATLLDRTGDLHAAIRDYTKVIDEFPNFWTGLHYRAGCYRRLGMNNKAEQDEFRILKAQMDKHLGKQPRWNRKKVSETRKKNDIDPNKYNQLIADDESVTEQEYKSEYRGRVQNRQVSNELQPYVIASINDYSNVTISHKPYSKELDEIGRIAGTPLYLNTLNNSLQEDQMKDAFARIDRITEEISHTTDPVLASKMLMVRCALNTMVQNYQEAISDAELYLAVDSTLALAWCQRAVCSARLAEFELSAANDYHSKLRVAGIVSDFERAIQLAPDNAYILYCRGSFHAHRKEYSQAIEYLTRAVTIDPYLPEAYYNRGIVNLNYGNKEQAITDLGKAGELGLYQAYSIIKSNSKK